METAILPAVMTTELATGTINIALTKEAISVQKLSDMESKLVYNEDNLPAIRLFLEEGRKARRILETLRKTLKEPYFQAGKKIDEVVKAIDSEFDNIMKRPDEQITSMSRDIENRRRQAELEAHRKQQILSGIDSNMVTFSQRITDCNTDKELVSIERLINLEKANKGKYAEFYAQALEKYNTLTHLLALQKDRIREANELAAKRLEAEKKGNDAEVLALNERQAALDVKIDEAKVTVQEAAINQTLSTVIEAKEIIPEAKTRHRIWTWEVVNILEATKKMPSWTKIEPVSEKIDEFMKASKGSWAESGKEEVTVNGIKFYLKKTY